jgi:hypothetical protein
VRVQTHINGYLCYCSYHERGNEDSLSGRCIESQLDGKQRQRVAMMDNAARENT